MKEQRNSQSKNAPLLIKMNFERANRNGGEGDTEFEVCRCLSTA